MNACPHCGSVAYSVDYLQHPLCSFCNSLGNSLLGGLDAPHAAGGYGGGYGGGGYGGGGGAPLRCQMGHEIAPGASYCAQGHPIALDAMPFAGDGYGQQQQGYPPPQQPGGYNPGGFQQQPPPQQPGGYNPGGYDQFNPGGGGFGGAPPPQQYAPQPPQQQYAPPQQQPQYAPPPPMQQPGMPGAPQQAYEPAPAQPAQLPPNAVRGFLVAFQSNPAGDYWVLTGGRHTVGRANSGEQVDIPLADATISSKHAAVSVDVGAGIITVEDRGSTNGTYVNEEHIGYSGRRDLRDGDKVRFGGFTTIVKIIAR